MAAALTVHDIEVEDIEYLRFGNKALLARLYKPRGEGPFPLLVDLHGGAWCRGDRLNDVVISEALARSGVAVAALDFRMPPDAPYPASLTDIHYGIRWLKTRPTRWAFVWTKWAPSASPAVATKRCCWPCGRMTRVTLPSSRRTALWTWSWAWITSSCAGRSLILWHATTMPKNLRDSGEPYPELVDRVLPLHDQYWQDEDAMAEGNPVLALERGETVEMPPVLYVQGTKDVAHPRPDLDRFVEQYRKAGGQVELKLFDGEAEGFINRKPTSAAAGQAVTQIIEFVHKHMG